jgi:hypothetical protein
MELNPNCSFLKWLPDSVKKPVFIVLLIISLVLTTWSFLLNKPLTTGAAPSGIISLEFAYNLDTAQKIIDSWTSTGKISAGISLGMDYLFLAVYVLAIGLGCALAAHVFYQKINLLCAAGIILSWSQIGAGFLDCIENVALIQLLLGSRLGILPVIAFFCAWPKFIITGVGILYVLAGGVVFILSKINK